jgi:hypothetical protein
MVNITKKHIFTIGPRKGRTEVREPYRNTDGFYRVYSPEGIVGKDGKRRRNIVENSRPVKTLSEVADYIEKGWGVRMTGPLTPSPSLCSKNIEVSR